MVRAGCVFVAGIHPSRAWTPGSFESVRWNACVHRLDLGLYSHPKEFGGRGDGVWTHVNSKGKIPSTGKCPQRRIELADAVDSEPKHYQRAIPAPDVMFSLPNVLIPREWSRSGMTMIKKKKNKKKVVDVVVGCLTSQQHASVSQWRICSDNFTCCHTEIEVADQTFHLAQSQYTDTGLTSPSANPITPGAWQGSHWSANF